MSITNYAQSSLGDVVFVELPSKGTTVSQGGMSASRAFYLSQFFLISGVYSPIDQIGAVESVKAASDIVERFPPTFMLIHSC